MSVVFANGGGCAPPNPPPLFLSRAERASKPKKLVDTHHVSRVAFTFDEIRPKCKQNRVSLGKNQRKPQGNDRISVQHVRKMGFSLGKT